MAVLLFGTNLLDKDSAAGERFMTAYLQGVKQFRKGKTDRNIEILSGATNLSRIQLEKICWPYIRENGEPHLKSLMDYQAWGVRKGLIKSPLDMNQIWDGRFIESAHRNSGAQGR